MQYPDSLNALDRPAGRTIGKEIALVSAKVTATAPRRWHVQAHLQSDDLDWHGLRTRGDGLTPRDFEIIQLGTTDPIRLVITSVRLDPIPGDVILQLEERAETELQFGERPSAHTLRLLRYPERKVNEDACAAILNFGPKPTPVGPNWFGEIDYLAKDFESMAAHMLQDLKRNLPSWEAGTPADVGITLVEMLAYVGDYLSYRQDFVGNEAFLNTAQMPTSLRRHARLLGYRPSGGAPARTIVSFEVLAPLTIPTGTPVLSAVGQSSSKIVMDHSQIPSAINKGAVCYETSVHLRARPDNNKVSILDYGMQDYVLTAGSTSATLLYADANRDDPLPLKPGDLVVILATGGTRGSEADDIAHPVRLTAVQLESGDSEGKQAGGIRLNIHWSDEDALPCDIAVTRPSIDGGRQVTAFVSANAVEVEFGWTGPPKDLTVPLNEDTAWNPTLIARPLPSGKVHPQSRNISQQQSAACFLSRRVGVDALPAMSLEALPICPGPQDVSEIWHPVHDLLSAGPNDPVFVVDDDDTGQVKLRFGDGIQGKRPSAGFVYRARIREATRSNASVGPGTLGVLGASKTQLDLFVGLVSNLTNYIPSRVALRGENKDAIRTNAPLSVPENEVAATLDDFTRLAQSIDGVKQAISIASNTPPWPKIQVSVLAETTHLASKTLLRRVQSSLDGVRLAGRQVLVSGPALIPVCIEMTIQAAEGAIAQDIAARIDTAIGRSDHSGTGLFSLESMAFERAIEATTILSTIQPLTGVADVTLTSFHRHDRPRELMPRLTFSGREVPIILGAFGDQAGGYVRATVKSAGQL